MTDFHELPAGWVMTTLGDVAKVIGGGTPSTNDLGNFDEEGIPWITPADLTGYQKKYIANGARFLSEKGLASSGAKMLPTGTVLFSSRAPIGYVAIASNPLCTNQGFKSFVLGYGLQPEYVYYYLKSAKELASSFASGTTFLELSGAKAATIPIPIAPLAEQSRIVAEIEKQFSRLDAAVASLRRAQANLKRCRASVLQAACEGRLVPTEAALARAEGRDYEPAGVLLARILAERRAKWEAEQLAKMQAQGKTPKDDAWKAKYQEPAGPETDGLPELPEEWVWASLLQCCLRITDGTHQPPIFTSEGVPFIFVQNITSGRLSFDKTKFISKDTYHLLNQRCPVETGDILYSAVGSYGIAVPVKEKNVFSFQRHIAHLKPVSLILQDYLVTLLNSAICKSQADMLARGVAQKTVTLGDLCRYHIAIPPFAEQTRIVAEVERRLSIIDELEATVTANLKRAERLRQAILQRAFTGKLVPQDPADEPAGVLLERIRAEREQTPKKAGRAAQARPAAGRKRVGVPAEQIETVTDTHGQGALKL